MARTDTIRTPSYSGPTSEAQEGFRAAALTGHALPRKAKEIRRKMEALLASGDPDAAEKIGDLKLVAAALHNRYEQLLENDDKFQNAKWYWDDASAQERSHWKVHDKILNDLTAIKGLTVTEPEYLEEAMEDIPDVSSTIRPEATGAALVAGGAGEVLARPSGALKTATKAAKRSLIGRAGADVQKASRAAGVAAREAGSLGGRRAAAGRAARAVEGALDLPASEGAEKLSRAESKLRGAQRHVVGQARRSAHHGAIAKKAAAQSAMSRQAAKSFVPVAARTAPVLTGAMLAGELLFAVEPVIAYYETTPKPYEGAKDLFRRVEYLVGTMGGPVSIDMLDTRDWKALSKSPPLLDHMLRQGHIDGDTYMSAAALDRGMAEHAIDVLHLEGENAEMLRFAASEEGKIEDLPPEEVPDVPIQQPLGVIPAKRYDTWEDAPVIPGRIGSEADTPATQDLKETRREEGRKREAPITHAPDLTEQPEEVLELEPREGGGEDIVTPPPPPQPPAPPAPLDVAPAPTPQHRKEVIKGVLERAQEARGGQKWLKGASRELPEGARTIEARGWTYAVDDASGRIKVIGTPKGHKAGMELNPTDTGQKAQWYQEIAEQIGFEPTTTEGPPLRRMGAIPVAPVPEDIQGVPGAPGQDLESMLMGSRLGRRH